MTDNLWKFYFAGLLTDDQLDNAMRLVNPCHWYKTENCLVETCLPDDEAIDILDELVGYV